MRDPTPSGSGPQPQPRRRASGSGRLVAVTAGALLVCSELAGCAGGTPAPSRGVGSTPATPATRPVTTSAASAPTDPVTVFEMADPVVRYQEYVAGQLALLVRQTRTLADDTAAGDDAAAERDWLTAHLTYHRLGAAYGAFGDLGKAVDGLARGLPRGTADPGFTGFHQVEYLLWRGGGARAAAPAAARLARDVVTLQARAGQLDIPANTFSTRAHEILENTLEFTLTGADDYGSGSGAATAAADLDGTRTVVGLLRPLLERRSPRLPARIDADLSAVQGALAAATAGGATGSGTGTPIARLPLAQRQRLDAAVGRALETLSVVPGLLAVQDED
ncbi:MAG TPA: EfeM/EfeO family lipoprotein [Kineosporiaceae bacterium]